ncbi:MAG: TrkA family potassium uptake protein [Bacteroidetes bacterium]|nr:TrkA family potassium uptake protein [Bacteroidota bacterium]
MNNYNQRNNHIIICGYGRNGKQAANNLLEHGESLVIIDKEESLNGKFQGDNSHFIQGDATEDDTLILANIKKAKALITTLPIDSDNLYVVLTARQINSSIKIVSRASNISSNSKLKKAGANFVVMPDLIGGRHMAKLVAQPDIVEFLDKMLLQSKDDVNLEEFSCENILKKFINKTIGELGIRNVSGANIVGIKTGVGNFIFNPSHKMKLSKKDKIFVLGTNNQLKMLINLLSEKKND